jgi:hypothetical protein
MSRVNIVKISPGICRKDGEKDCDSAMLRAMAVARLREFSWLPICHAKKAPAGAPSNIAGLFSVPGKASSNDHEEHRNKEDRQQCRG